MKSRGWNGAGQSTGPGRPRDPALDRRIRGAAHRVFRERGWIHATMEEVASRADVSKATLYRRYPSKAALAFDAWVGDRDERFPNTDTGSVWGDLTAFVLGTAQMAVTGGWSVVLPGLLAERRTDPEVAAAIDGVLSWRFGVVEQIVQRAKARGEIRHDVDPHDLHELIDGRLILRVLMTGDPLDMTFTDRLLDDVTAVAR
jgi:AcrR family transcriptional regulator